MTKTVFDNASVAHIWAQQTQAEGRSSNGNFWFSGDTIKSYQTIMAKMVTIGGKRCALLNGESYSVTTSQHQNLIRQALPPGVLRIHSYGSRAAESIACCDYVTICKMLIKKALDYAIKQKRARSNGSKAFYAETLEETLESAKQLASLAKIKSRVKIPEDLEHLASVEIKRCAAERKARKIEFARLQKERRAHDLEAFKAWQSGQRNACPQAYMRDENGAVYMRIIRGALRLRDETRQNPAMDTLQTSMGARVPLADAIQVFRLAKWCRAKGKRLVLRGTLRAGHFPIDLINKDGSFKAGCHNFTWERIEETAKVAGVLDMAPKAPDQIMSAAL